MPDDSDWILQRRTEHPARLPDLTRGFEVLEVFPYSPAESAGLCAGMVHLADDVNMLTFNPGELPSRGRTGIVATRFWNPSDETIIYLETIGFPHGIKLVPTVERLCEQRYYFSNVSKYYFDRALEGSDEELAALAAAAHNSRASINPIAVMQRLATRIFVAIVERQSLGFLWSQERIIEAAHAAETGQFARARKLQPEATYDIVFASGTAAAALYFYTDALIAEADGADPQDVRERLDEAYDTVNSGGKRIASRIAKLTGSMPSRSQSHAPRQMPNDYLFVEHDPTTGPVPHNPTRISLFETLDEMNDSQCAIVILLGGYRANGFYDPMIRELAQIYPSIADRFPAVHVITSFDPDSSSETYRLWLEGETYARQRKVPIRLLFDPTHSIEDSLPTNYSPHVAIIDTSRTIVHEGSLGFEEGIWKTMART